MWSKTKLGALCFLWNKKQNTVTASHEIHVKVCDIFIKNNYLLPLDKFRLISKFSEHQTFSVSLPRLLQFWHTKDCDVLFLRNKTFLKHFLLFKNNWLKYIAWNFHVFYQRKIIIAFFRFPRFFPYQFAAWMLFSNMKLYFKLAYLNEKPEVSDLLKTFFLGKR